MRHNEDKHFTPRSVMPNERQKPSSREKLTVALLALCIILQY